MITWVEVPVPDGMVHEVQDFINRLILSGSVPGWEDEAIDTHLRALAPDVQKLVCVVAKHLLEGQAADDASLAASFGVSQREVHGLVQEANEITHEPFPGALLYVRHIRIGDEETASTRCEVYMLREFAVRVDRWWVNNG